MRNRISILVLAAMLACASAGTAVAGGGEQSVRGAGGYDLVSYRTGEKPLPGNGNHLSEVDGVIYLFVSDENKKAFDKNPEKYLPVYGGYCAYGVAVGKKFVGDPHVWKIVDGRLYLNLDNKIQGSGARTFPGTSERQTRGGRRFMVNTSRPFDQST
jgi:YHS domain-containing protein